jgi:hypothetical protein
MVEVVGPVLEQKGLIETSRSETNDGVLTARVKGKRGSKSCCCRHIESSSLWVHGEKESSSSNARRRRRTAGHHGDMMIDDVAVSHFGKKILRDSKGVLCFSGPFYHKGRKSARTQKKLLGSG